MHRIVFDPIYLLPGSPELQETFGGTVPFDRFESLFPKETWLTAETYLMSLAEVSDEQLDEFSSVAKERAAHRLVYR